jgi:hypothetical protein
MSPYDDPPLAPAAWSTGCPNTRNPCVFLRESSSHFQRGAREGPIHHDGNRYEKHRQKRNRRVNSAVAHIYN